MSKGQQNRQAKKARNDAAAPDPLLVELADTVTEMREVKHAYQKGILAQRGIEY